MNLSNFRLTNRDLTMKQKVGNIVLCICLSILFFAFGMVIGVRTQLSETTVYEEGIPIVCTVTAHIYPTGTNPTNSTFRIRYSYEIYGETKTDSQHVSEELFYRLSVGDKALGFLYKNQSNVLFDVPVISSDEQGITIR